MNSQNPNPDEGQKPDNRPDAEPGKPGTEPPPEAQQQAAPQAEALTPPPLYSPPDPRGASAQARPQDFFGWIRSHGIHRGRERWIGGVSSGIAQRMGIDPLIVRGIFIVLALFAGIGVLLYGLAWALLPEPDGRIHLQEAAAGHWTSGMTGALITTIVGLSGLGGGFWGWGRNGFGGFFWTLFWVGGTIFLIYYLTQRNKTRNGALPMNNRTQAGSPLGAAAFGATASGSGHDAGTYNGGPAAYGAYPAADAYPGYGSNPPSGPNPPYGGGFGNVPPGRPGPKPKVRRAGPGAPAVAVTAGVALLVGGGIKALDAGNVIDLGNATNAVVWASSAAVLGLGILVSGLKGRSSGILGFFAVVALVIGGIFNVVANGDRFRLQDGEWNPVSVEQARDGFQIMGGRGTVDLTKLNLNTPLASDVVIPLDVTASNLTVVIPDNVPVQVRADMTLGNLNEGSQHRGGTTTKESNYNTDKPGARLIIQIDGTVSNVTIKEGN